MEQGKFRRPAMLEPETLEYLEGEEDPAVSRESAHTAARIFVDAPAGQWSDPDPQTARALVDAVRREGPDLLAELWAHSPAETLPGALWRLTKIYLQVHADIQYFTDLTGKGFAEHAAGKSATPGCKVDVAGWDNEVTQLLAAKGTADFAQLLEHSANLLAAFAAGLRAEGAAARKVELLQHTAAELTLARSLFKAGKLD